MIFFRCRFCCLFNKFLIPELSIPVCWPNPPCRSNLPYLNVVDAAALQTVTGVTGDTGKPIGDALSSLGNGVEGGAKNVGNATEDAGKGKKDFLSK